MAAVCSAASEPSQEDLATAQAAAEGAFDAFDEACLGEGDLHASLSRAAENGWTEFTPPADSMMGQRQEMLLDDPMLDSGKTVFLRKSSNRAEIAMVEARPFSGADYIFKCEAVEPDAANLDLADLEAWADVPIEERQIDGGPVYYDLKGGRFADGLGGDATAYFSSNSSGSETLRGLIISTDRSSFLEEVN